MWILFSVFAALSFTGIFLIFKYLASFNIPTPVSLTWVFLVASLLLIGHNVATKQSLQMGGAALALLIGAGVLSYIGNTFQFRALVLAPNPGYAIALISVQALLVTVVSVFLFGSDFSMLKATGVFLSICGVMILSLG